ncbi:MAG: flavodoxin domain-containing protein, partial [Planctomycetota bacterium]
WGLGDLQDDWEALLGKAGGVKLGGKKVAIFGLGDAGGYPDTFVDGMADLAAFAAERGAEVMGAFPAACYGADASRSEEDGRYVGLALDEDGHGELTEDRLLAWSALLKASFT